MKLNENRLNTKHAVIYGMLGLTYPILFFALMFYLDNFLPEKPFAMVCLTFSLTIVWNLIIMLLVKFNSELERDFKLMDYYAFAAIRKPGQAFDWKGAIVKYEKGEMDGFLKKFLYVKILLAVGLLLIFFTF